MQLIKILNSHPSFLSDELVVKNLLSETLAFGNTGFRKHWALRITKSWWTRLSSGRTHISRARRELGIVHDRPSDNAPGKVVFFELQPRQSEQPLARRAGPFRPQKEGFSLAIFPKSRRIPIAPLASKTLAGPPANFRRNVRGIPPTVRNSEQIVI